MSNVTVVVGGQFGSEGKGAIVAHLSKNLTAKDTVIRVAGPNAGHTAYSPDGSQWKLRALPVAAVVNKECGLHIAAGSEIDLDVLAREIESAEAVGHKIRGRLTIHPSATILEPRHISQEGESGLVGRIGSTGKGIGAARADRIWRKAATFGQFVNDVTLGMPGNIGYWSEFLGEPGPFKLGDSDTQVIVEGTQGYGLGLHTEFYPQVTSSDTRAIDFLAMAGISPWSLDVDELHVVIVARMFPIRVAGNSGPLTNETSWEDLGLTEERTTVTNLVRRVGRWDFPLIMAAIQANGGGDWNPNVTVALTMLDQSFRDQKYRTELDDAPLEFVRDLETRMETFISHVGTGPSSVVEL